MATTEAKLRDLGGEAVERLEQQDWLEPLADGLQRAIAAMYEAGGTAGRRVRDVLHGTWLGHPLHPVLTDVPLGAWTVVATIDLLSGNNRRENRAADTAVVVGLVGAAGAAVTGLTDWQHTAGGARRVGLMHGLINISATGMYALSLALRIRGDRRAARTVGGLGLGLAMAAAYLGGHLVFRKRIGVDHAPRVEWDDFVPVLAESALAESTARRVDVRGVPLVLVRKAGRVHALADQCAHLGGPLSEGSLDDVSIRCPWHGSRFALDDGAVMEGPSTFPQPCFDVRSRAGQIEVRPRK
jgi:nitrite reductase/ring-hydroxylating ferredoxin subunit/uncharacterized membrane protein